LKDLNAAEIVELEGEAIEFVRNRALDGVGCIVIMIGRGHSYVGYAEDLKDCIPQLLQRAYLTAQKNRRGEMN